jgi:Nickel responsive protein SCO4226-like
MTDLFLERSFEPPLVAADVLSMAGESRWCFEIHRVDWHGSLLAADGRTMVCHFSSADAESVRMALRQARIDSRRLWAGTVHEVPGRGAANVLVERSFAGPVALEDIQAIEDAKQWCLDLRNVQFVRTFFSRDRKRMLCLYAAPDAEAVREAQREAGMPVERVWAFERVGPRPPGD